MNDQSGTSGRNGAPRDGPPVPPSWASRVPDAGPRRGPPAGQAHQEAPIDHEGATSLLRLGLTGPPRGVDDVIHRLGLGDGAEWFESALLALPARSADEARKLLIEGSASLEQLRQAKERHKERMLSPGAKPERHRAILLYYLSVAAALAHHGRSLTSQPRPDLDGALLDLAVALPEPWSLMLARAADPG